jgi:hydrogenase expression/formation protein HypE
VSPPEPSAGAAFDACPAPLPPPKGEVTLGHGSGGRLSHRLLRELFLPAFDHPALAAGDDQAVLEVGGATVAFTTDTFTVSPLFFPGGDIGDLAVNGTVNDLACAGARPLYLSAGFVIEEGYALADLARVVESMRRAARAAGVAVVTGDTKVVQRGKGDGLYVNTSGLGLLDPGAPRRTAASCRAGDLVLVSGTLGDHGVAVMAVRERLGLGDELRSDTAPLHELAQALLAAAPGTRCLRDPTRGGLAAALVELGGKAGCAAEVDEDALPLSEPVRGALELLGLDPLFVANEGKLVAIVPAAEADAALAAWRAHPLGRAAARVGRMVEGRPGALTVRTRIGGRRTVELPLTDPLPRIC